MKVLMIYPEFPLSIWSMRESCRLMGRKALIPPLSLITVAAMLPGDWPVRLVDLNCESLTEAHWNWAEIIMLSGMIVQKEAILALIQEGKARNKTVVVGGHYAASLPEEVLAAGCDYMMKGEAELIMPQLIEAISNGGGKRVFESQDKPDLALSPLPRFDLLNFRDYLGMPVQVSRGCPFDCEFCDITRTYGRITRYKTPEQVTAELDFLFKLGWRGNIFISDDNFIGHRTRAKAVLRELIKWMEANGEPFALWTEVSINLGQDLEMIDLMTAANFDLVFIGVESPDEEVLSTTGKHQNLKNPLAESINNITRNGLSVMTAFIIGLDGEKPGVSKNIVKLVEETAIPVPQLNFLHILPNTRLWHRLEQEGRLRPEKTTGPSIMMALSDTPMELNYVPTRPAMEIYREFIWMWEHVFKPENFLKRSAKYHQLMRPTRKAMAQKAGKEPEKKGAPKAQKPVRELCWDIWSFLVMTFRQGIAAPSRGLYWKMLFTVMRKNPSRARKYIISCGLAESMFRLTDITKKRCGIK